MIHIAIFKYALYFMEKKSNGFYWGILLISLILGIIYHIMFEKIISTIKENKKMKIIKNIKIASLLMMTLLVTAGCSKVSSTDDVISTGEKETVVASSLNDDKVYKISTETSFAPFAYSDDDGNYVGIDLDLFAAIAENQNIKYEYQYLGFEAACASLETGQADGAICCLSIKEERKEKYDFSDPYYTSSVVTITHKDNGVETMEDMKDFKIGAKMGTDAESYANDLAEKYGMEVVLLDNTANGIMMLQSNSLDAFIEDSSVAKAAVAKDDTLRLIGDEGYVTEIGFAVPKDQNPELLEAFNKGLAELKANGQYDEIMSKYLD